MTNTILALLAGLPIGAVLGTIAANHHHRARKATS